MKNKSTKSQSYNSSKDRAINVSKPIIKVGKPSINVSKPVINVKKNNYKKSGKFA